MKELIKELINNSIFSNISLMISSIATIAAAFSAFFAYKTSKANKYTLKEMQIQRLESTQNFYPFMAINVKNDTINNLGRISPKQGDSIIVGKYKFANSKGIEILIDNGVLDIDNKPYIAHQFKLVNVSDARIKKLILKNLSIMKPESLNGNKIKLIKNSFDTINYELSSSIISNGDDIEICLLLFFDKNEYLKYFQLEFFTFTLIVEIEIITGLKYYQQVIFDGGDVEYHCATDINDLEAKTLEYSYIDII